MIIVSQDKTNIVNFDNLTPIYITQDEEKTAFFIRYETVDSLYDDLGFYKTEERAKEVLQEIVKTTIETRKNQNFNSLFGGLEIIPQNTYYEMPED
ncbi:MAG: hypothetical protein BHW01_05660 [Clostridium sp. 27_14]|nr:MAG: hypothetical protein BHW01_05660 [Clostridium sp. 27_14]